jgi:hypothetical protein
LFFEANTGQERRDGLAAPALALHGKDAVQGCAFAFGIGASIL